MAFNKITKDMNIIAALDDEPNDVGGLTAAQLKAKFDEGGVALKTFINNLLDAIAAGTAAANIGAEDLNGVATDLQTALDNIAGAVIGTLPDGAVTTAKLHDGAVTNGKITDGTIKDAKLDWATSAITRVEIVSWVGTGTYSNTIAFTNLPKIVFIYGRGNQDMSQDVNSLTAHNPLYWQALVDGVSIQYHSILTIPYASSWANAYYSLSNDNKTITLTPKYPENNDDSIFNDDSMTYTAISFY